MINLKEVIETNKMIQDENLDVRTITMGVSLLDCADSNLESCCANIYAKLLRCAGRLVKTGEEISREFGIPIVNKRVSITPAALVGASCCRRPEDYVEIARTLDRAARELGVNFLGGFSAVVSKGMTPSDELLIRSIPEALAVTDRICSSVNVGSTKTGIDMDAVRLMGEIVKATAERTKDRDSLGADFETLCETIKRTAFKITRVGQLVAQEASRRLGVPFGIIDLSLAPTPAVGDSVADILKEIGLAHPGAPGTTAALALLNDQVKKGGVMASSYVGGLSGAFIPVSEDQGMIDAVEAGALTIEKLEAMTCVCSVGLDMIAVPGDTSAATIAGIIADEAAIGMVNQKTTAVRIIPVVGKGVGDTVEFGGLLGHAPIMPVNGFDCSRFVGRKGRIPAPIHSFKN